MGYRMLGKKGGAWFDWAVDCLYFRDDKAFEAFWEGKGMGKGFAGRAKREVRYRLRVV